MTNKINTRFLVLVVKCLEIPDKLLENFVAIPKILWSDNRTLKYLNPSNQFSVIFPVWLWKDVSKQHQSKSIDIQLKSPSFVPGIELVS